MSEKIHFTSDDEPIVETEASLWDGYLENSSEVRADNIINKAKHNHGLKSLLNTKAKRAIAVAVAVLSTIAIIKSSTINREEDNLSFGLNSLDPLASTYVSHETTHTVSEVDNPRTENQNNVGELPNGLKFDYRERDDVGNKETEDAFGYNYEYLYGDGQGLLEAHRSQAERNPEILAAYAEKFLTDDEKTQLGIPGDRDSILRFLKTDTRGGELQKEILKIMDQTEVAVSFGKRGPSKWLTIPLRGENDNTSYGEEEAPTVNVAHIHRTLPDGRQVLAYSLRLDHGLTIPLEKPLKLYDLRTVYPEDQEEANTDDEAMAFKFLEDDEAPTSTTETSQTEDPQA